MAAPQDEAHVDEGVRRFNMTNRRIAGICDGGLVIKFGKNKNGHRVMHVWVESSNPDTIFQLRKVFPPSKVFIQDLAQTNGNIRGSAIKARAEFVGVKRLELLLNLKYRGIASRGIAKIAYNTLRNRSKHTIEEAEQLIDAEMKYVEDTIEIAKEVKRRSSKNEEDTDAAAAAADSDDDEEQAKTKTQLMASDAEVEKVCKDFNDEWFKGFLDTAAVIKTVEVDDGDATKISRVTISTKGPHKLAVATAIQKRIGAGKVFDKRTRVQFSSQREIQKLREALNGMYDPSEPRWLKL